MCSNGCDVTDIEKQASLSKGKKTNCKKCGSNNVFVLLQKEHCYCKDCFHEYCSHKFRATIGKTRLVKKGQRVLVAVSGGPSSMAMLQMIEEGLSLENHHRRLQFSPVLLFVDESVIIENTQDIHNRMKQYRISKPLDCYITRLESAFRDNNDNFVATTGEEVPKNEENANSLVLMMKSLTSDSSREELLRRIRNQLIVDVAVHLKCDCIFNGSSGSRLAVEMIVDAAQGKGNGISQEMGFLDDRLSIPVLKPMREFVNKEVAYFLKMKNLEPINVSGILTKASTKASLGKVTECFINNLENDFPATTYSLCRISAKLKCKDDSRRDKCILCHTPSDQITQEKSSALAALHVSRNLCQEHDERIDDDEMSSLSLCYSCSQVVSESEVVKDRIRFLHHVIQQKQRETEPDRQEEANDDNLRNLRKDIEDFLLQ